MELPSGNFIQFAMEAMACFDDLLSALNRHWTATDRWLTDEVERCVIAGWTISVAPGMIVGLSSVHHLIL